jgi:hypothetical protein
LKEREMKKLASTLTIIIFLNKIYEVIWRQQVAAQCEEYVATDSEIKGSNPPTEVGFHSP